MFSPIKAHMAGVNPASINYEELLDHALEHFDCDMSSLDEAESLSEAMTRLNTLKVSIESYGLTPSLLAFADSAGSLSSHVPAMPCLESFVATESFDQTAAIEGIVSTIKETTKRWLTAIKDHIVKYKKFCIAGLAIIVAATAAVVGYKKITAAPPPVNWKEDFSKSIDKLETATIRSWGHDAMLNMHTGDNSPDEMVSKAPSRKMYTDFFDSIKHATSPGEIVSLAQRNIDEGTKKYKENLTIIKEVEGYLAGGNLSAHERNLCRLALRKAKWSSLGNLRHIRLFERVAAKAAHLYKNKNKVPKTL